MTREEKMQNKVVVAMSLDKEVVADLDDRADGFNKGGEKLVSRSSLGNFALRKFLGLPVSERMEDLMEE